jgi:hypothetical protein
MSEEAYEAPDWIKDETWFAGKSPSDIESRLVWSYRIAFGKSLLLCVAGIAAGVLVLKRHRWGRFLAIVLSMYVLVVRIVHIAKLSHPFELLYWKYTTFIWQHPFRVIHLDIVKCLVLLVVVVHLLRPSVGRQFEKNEKRREKSEE